jgi:hypothetical protein
MLAKIAPGRSARFAGKELIFAFEITRALRREVPSCGLHVQINSIQTDVGACGGTPAINNDQSSQG